MISEELHALQAKIARELSNRPECFITHPTETALLQKMTEAELEDFAHRNGWRVVRRLGGEQIQFYNDATERLLNEASEG